MKQKAGVTFQSDATSANDFSASRVIGFQFINLKVKAIHSSPAEFIYVYIVYTRFEYPLFHFVEKKLLKFNLGLDPVLIAIS